MIKKTKFRKAPLSQEEKEQKAEEFMNLTERPPKELKIVPLKKEPIKPLYLRAPQSYLDDIQKITALTGLSRNAICLELLRPAIKKKLRELRED